MNTEDKIPTPKITFPNKAALKRKPLVQTWTKVAAAATVVVALGLGYFFSQWSAPPTIVVAQALTEAPIVVTQEAKPEEPVAVDNIEPVVTVAKPTSKVVIEHRTVEIDTTVTKNIIKPIATSIEPIVVELAVNTLPQISTHVPEILVEESRERLLDIAFMAEYGSDVVEQIKRIPHGIVQLARSYTQPFNKKDKQQE